MQQEWENMPKDINRNQYLKRINEIIKNVKEQNSTTKSLVEEIKDLKQTTVDVTQQIKKIDEEVEERVFKDTAKDKVAKDIYKEIQTLKSNFDQLITAVQEENKLRTQIHDIESKKLDFRLKYKNMAEINKLKQELDQVVADN